MVAMFAAFARPRLLQRLWSIALSDGGFTASLSGQFYHDVVLDEAHKDTKKVITRPSKDYLQQMADYHQHRAPCLLNLTEEVLISKWQ